MRGRKLEFLTEEQVKVVEAVRDEGVVITNALAGTGKTTTCLAVAEAYPQWKVLYLVFNRSMMEEARQKSKSFHNVKCMTVHALAWSFMAKYMGQRKPENLRAGHISSFLDIDPRSAYFLLEAFMQYLHSSCDTVTEFVDMHWERLEGYFTRKTLTLHLQRIEMGIKEGELPMPHDYYLKEFIRLLGKKKILFLNWDLVILDEAQDANPAFVTLLQRLHTRRLLLVGDMHQRIYGFRGTVNIMKAFPSAQVLFLTTSFRFSEELAHFANQLLDLKYSIFKYPENERVFLRGLSSRDTEKKKAIITRTNAELISLSLRLKKNVAYTRKIEDIAKIPYTLACLLEGENPYEVAESEGLPLSLVDAKIYHHYSRMTPEQIIEELEILSREREFSLTGLEADLLAAADLAQDLGLRTIVRFLKNELRRENEKKDHCDIWLTTAHSAKGLEWEEVEIAEDFPSLVGLTREDEWNLLYVASTRCTKKLSIPPYLQLQVEYLQDYLSKNQTTQTCH